MTQQTVLVFLGFICLFHLIGGLVVGSFFRQLRNGGSWSEFNRLVWGLAAGGLPMVIGASMFADAGMPHLVAVEVFVFSAAALVVAFFPDWFAEPFRSPHVKQIFFGGVFIIVGIMVAILAWRASGWVAVLIGLAFVGAGALLFVPAFKALLGQNIGDGHADDR